ncbi:MAG: glycosyltransferase family 2 protein [Planctomycetota bacterium]|nr:glycosyltransferase family 2 protein [Planctomycetota bacterium]
MSEVPGPGAAPYVTLVAPVYNEKECIEEFVQEADRELAKLGKPYELLCVDDGSKDGSREILIGLKKTYPSLRVVGLQKNTGQSAAFDAGIRFAKGEIIVLIDSDLQNDPADIAELVAVLEGPEKPTCAAGRRANRKDTWFRKIQSKIANGVRIWLTGDPIKDTGCSLKAFRGEVLKRCKMYKGMHRFLTTLIRMEGGTVVEVDVNHRPRSKGTPKYGGGLGRTFVALRDAFAVRWMQSRYLLYKADEL